MASRGIKDRVAIIGMGCTRFGEHWDKGADDLLIDAAYDAYESARIDPNDIDEAVRAIEASGGTITERGEFEPGAPYLFARDPDGHVIEIWYETGDSGSAETP